MSNQANKYGTASAPVAQGSEEQVPLAFRILAVLDHAYTLSYAADASNAAANMGTEVRLRPLTRALADLHKELAETIAPPTLEPEAGQ